MATWDDFAKASPDMAAAGRRLLYRNGDGEALLVTVRGAETPRAHPVNVGVVDGHLYTFVQAASSKRRDLDEDGRYALHTHMDPAAPHEFLVRGHAKPVEDDATRGAVAAGWFFTVNDLYPLYELLIEQVVFGERATSDDWPPVYSRWTE